MIFKKGLNVVFFILGCVVFIVFYQFWNFNKSVIMLNDKPLLEKRIPSTFQKKIPPESHKKNRKHFRKPRLRNKITTPSPWKPKVKMDLSRKKTQVLRWNRGVWEEWLNFCPEKHKFQPAALKTPAGQTTIFIHDISVDKLVSGSIKEQGSWEGDILKLIYYFLSSEPDLHLIDLGAHVGEFSLMAAQMGRQAVAVDPLFENVQRLCKSVEINGFCPQIKVFYSALSNTRTKVSFRKEIGNIGGTKIFELDLAIKENSVMTPLKTPDVRIVRTPLQFNKNEIETNLLDDMLPLMSFKNAFMKIDVEEHENFVLLGSDKFFRSLNVRYVFMEWFQHAARPNSAKQIIDFMKKHNYSAESPDKNHSPLDYKLYDKWPLHVLWVKK